MSKRIGTQMAATPGSKCTMFTRGEVHRDFHVG
jgi:hypothetical protein